MQYINREWKIVHYGRLGQLDVYVRLGAMTVRRRENFQFKNGQQNRGW